MRLPLTMIALVSTMCAAWTGEILFSDGFDEALSSGLQRPACPPWSRAGSARDDISLASTTLEADSDNRFGDGADAAVAVLLDMSPEKQAFLLGNKIFESKAVDITFDFIEAEGPAKGGAFYVNIGGGEGSGEGDVVNRLNFVKGRMLGLKNAYQVEQKVHVRIVANNGAQPLGYENRTLPSRTFDVWIDGELALEAEPFNAQPNAVAPDAPLTSLGFLTYTAPTTAQKVYLKNIKVNSLP